MRARRAARGLRRARAERGTIRADNREASAAVLLASLTHYPILNVLIGHSPGDINADRFAETWVQHAAATLGN